MVRNADKHVINSFVQQEQEYAQELAVLITEHYTQEASEISQFLDMIQAESSGFILAS